MITRVMSLILLAAITSHRLSAQNIVPNGKFDSVNICTEHHAPCCPKGWFFCSLTSHQTYGTIRFSPGNLCHSLAMLAADREKWSRDYWQTHLLCPLQAGTHYRIRLKISASYFGPNLHDIGFYFTDHFIFTRFDTLLRPEHYIGFMDATVQDLKFGWFQLEKEFTATGSGSILIIGNFSPESNRQLLKKRGKKAVDILVTDISVQPLDGPLCTDAQNTRAELFAITNRHSYLDLQTIAASFDENRHLAKTTVEPAKPQTADLSAIQAPEQPPIPHIDTLRIPDIDFQFDSYHLTDSAVLDASRPLLEKPIDHILIAGYTDDKGTEGYNIILSQQRAQQVAELLESRYGIEPGIITADGRGISHTYKNDAANRRVEIYIYH
jgi:outer membrane protein OmpA-like peptidoglycan-associated protein